MGACCLSLCHIDLAMKMTPVTPASPTNVTSGFIVMAMGQHLRLEELIWEPDVPKSAGDYWRSPEFRKKICVAIIRCFRRSLRMSTQPFPPNRLKQVLGILSWFDSVWLQQVGKQTSLDTYGMTGAGMLAPTPVFVLPTLRRRELRFTVGPLVPFFCGSWLGTLAFLWEVPAWLAQ